MRRLHAVAEHDPVAAAAFTKVVTLDQRPPHMLRPAVAFRVLRPRRPARSLTARAYATADVG